MADPGVPDSWDQNDGQDTSASIQKPLAGLSFNPNAMSFVPGKNVHASSFVPGPGTFSPPVATQSDEPLPQESTPAAIGEYG